MITKLHIRGSVKAEARGGGIGTPARKGASTSGGSVREFREQLFRAWEAARSGPKQVFTRPRGIPSALHRT
ncbi:hypothetical protein GCM10010377_49010 [Streptomyces viridiviolaceus]|nr:hypothetical protein GCM10010377_49010 [Streptomyces viridiviolaceus]